METIHDLIEVHKRNIEDNVGNVDRMNVFFVHSLGGGTGSGIFPIIASIISDKVRDMGVDTYVSGIGVISKVKDPAIVEEPGFRPNTYASFRDVMRMSDDEERVLPLYSKRKPDETETIDGRLEDPEETDRLIQDPFDNYWFVGINESLKQTGTKTGQMESYMEEVDNAVGESILSISRRKGDKENWSTKQGVAGSLGESEVAVPIEVMEEYCQTLEDSISQKESLYGGEIPEKYRELERDKQQTESPYRTSLHRQIRDIDDNIDEIIDATLGENFEEESGGFNIKDEIESLGGQPKDIFDPNEGIKEAVDSVYDGVDACEVAKLKVKDIFLNQIDKHREEVVSRYNETVDELCGKEQYDVPMKDVSRKQRRISLEREIQEEIEEKEGLKESLEFGNIKKFLEGVKKVVLGSYFLPPEKSQIESDIQEAKDDRVELNNATRLKKNMEDMVDYIEEKHLSTKESLKESVRDLYDTKTDLDEYKFTLSNAKYSTRLGYLPVNREVIEEDLTSEWLKNNISDIQDCFDKGLVKEEDFEDAIDKQLEASFPWEDAVMMSGDPTEIDGDYNGNENQASWVFYHKDNEELTEDIVDELDYAGTDIKSSGGDELKYSVDPFRVKFVSMYNTPYVDGLEVYQTLDGLADSDDLGTFTNESPYDDWRQAHAYPEWYGDDVREAFGVEKTVTLHKPPGLDWENHVDTSDIKQDAETYAKKYALFEYLYQGRHWERYKAYEENWFEGWSKTLEEEAGIDKSRLKDLAPSNEKRSRWARGTLEWSELVREFEQKMLQKESVMINWDLPEEQKEGVWD
jgi:regulator of sigma D